MIQEEHPVWQTGLRKVDYHEEGQKEIEQMYDKLSGILSRLTGPQTLMLYTICNESFHEFFTILADKANVQFLNASSRPEENTNG